MISFGYEKVTIEMDFLYFQTKSDLYLVRVCLRFFFFLSEKSHP